MEAFHLRPSSAPYVFINSHGLGSDKNEWSRFQEKLKDAGYGYLSLDLRGHGASRTCAGKEVDYRDFSEADWNNVSRDIEAAAAWLRKKGVPEKKMIFCGASIGANLSLKAAAEGRLKPAAVILLSPGVEYAGVKTAENYISKHTFKILVAASEDDPYAWQSYIYLSRSASEKGLPADFINGGSGHGVNMFKTPSVIPAILTWVSGI